MSRREAPRESSVRASAGPGSGEARSPASGLVARPLPLHLLSKLDRVLAPLTVTVAGMLAFRRLDDADTWWHLASGRWIVAHHAVPRTDTLSYTVPDHAWINLQWLFDLLVYGLYRAGGPSLVMLAGVVLFAATTALLLENLRFALGPAAASAMALWIVAIAQGRFNVRPEMASFLFLQIVLLVCSAARRSRTRWLWALPAVMLLWVNTHGLFVMGAFVIAAYMGAAVADRLTFLPRAWRGPTEATQTRTMLLSGGVALLATMANPYGLVGVLFPLKLMTRISGTAPVFQLVGEFRRSFSPDNVTFAVRAYEAFFFFTLAVVIVAVSVVTFAGRPRGRSTGPDHRRRKRRQGGRQGEANGSPVAAEEGPRLDLAGLVIFVGLAYLSTLARRNMALFALGAAPFAAQCLGLLHRRWSGAVPNRATRQRLASATGAIVFLTLLVSGWLVASNSFYLWDGQVHEFGDGVLEVSNPVKASAFAKEQKLPAPLYNDLSGGGYLAWDRPLDTGVYIDGRLEVYDDQFFSDYIRRLKEPARWQEDADRLGVQTVILWHWYTAYRYLMGWLLRDARWALVYFDENATIFVRRAGNESIIARATRAFEPLREQHARALLGPVSSWQRAPGRATGLFAYGGVLDAMGRNEEATPFFSRLLEIGTSPKYEAMAAVRLAQYYAARGETDAARAYLRRAAAADPSNASIAPLRNRIGG
jgi:tetratricopeptide (TPR) repeat protein